MVLGSFFYGFTASVFPGGMAAERFGGKIMIQIATLGTAICSLLSPLAARQGGIGWFIAVRALMGIFAVSIVLVSLTME